MYNSVSQLGGITFSFKYGVVSQYSYVSGIIYGDKTSFEPMLTETHDDIWRHWTSLS